MVWVLDQVGIHSPTWPYLSEMKVEETDIHTVCALGLAMYKRIGVEDDADMSAHRYASEIFGLRHLTDGWSYLFHGRWQKHEPSPIQAADRINTFLTTGVPNGFDITTM